MDIVLIMRNANKFKFRLKTASVFLCASFAALPHAGAQTKLTTTISKPLIQAVPDSYKKIRTIDAIVAVVNSDVITRQELEDRMRIVERRISSQGGGVPPRADLQRQLLERMIVESAQMQVAKELGIKVDDIMLDRATARIAEQNKLSLQDFRNELERQGTPFARFREEIRREMIMQRVRDREVDNKIQVSESEIDNYLVAENGASAQEELNLAQILVRIPENASPEQIAERRKRADNLLLQLKNGADFAQLAATSSDSNDAMKGGDLGWRNQDRLPQLFVEAVAGLKPNDLSAVVKSANGFHILKFVGKRKMSLAKAGAATASVQQTHVRHILIKVNQIVSSLDAQRKLTDLKQRLDHKAAKFEDLAKLYSNDLSASKGGDLGWIYPGDTVPEFERAMNALKPGQVSEPIESPFGYHLIQVLERKTDDVSQERQRMAARLAIRERKLEEATEEWLRQLRDRAYVEYRLEDK